MQLGSLIREIVATYEKHSWQLRRVLLRTETRADLTDAGGLPASAPIVEATVDALWFSRPSPGLREAWELRLLAETPYALFEAFGPQESEESREAKRREMEERLEKAENLVISNEDKL
jgi:hypothetical protein